RKPRPLPRPGGAPRARRSARGGTARCAPRRNVLPARLVLARRARHLLEQRGSARRSLRGDRGRAGATAAGRMGVSGWRTTILLVAVFAALLAYVLATGKPRNRSPRRPSRAAPPPLAPAGSPARLEISTARQRVIAAATPQGWRLTPEAGAAEEVDALLAALRSLRPLLTVDPSPQDPADYGLGAAADRLRLLDD